MLPVESTPIAQLDTIVLASGNRGKLAELNRILQPAGIDAIAQTEFGVPEAEETGATFVENAIIKARNASHHSGRPALADDSGLVVDALGGRPGIRSARYSGDNACDSSNNEKLLLELLYVPEGQRGAYFYCVIALLRDADDPCPLICQGSWSGRILSQPRGEQGFGYDPLFYVADHQCSAAELDPSTKARISHRGQAMASLLQLLHTHD